MVIIFAMETIREIIWIWEMESSV